MSTATRPFCWSEGATCCVCGATALEEISAFSARRRVTSDCRPWAAGGRLAVCAACACVQKPADADLLRQLDAIYAGYAIYHQGGGAEQALFDPQGQAAPRSFLLVEALCSRLALPPSGRLLDVGCGNGATLRAFSEARPGWSLVGTELDDRHRSRIESIRGVESLLTCAPKDAPGQFDLITMVHVLEHVPCPAALLADLRGKLSGTGLLVVEAHYSAATVARLLRRAGYAATVAEDWLPKEWTAVARAAAAAPFAPLPEVAPASVRQSVESDLRWLARVVEAARHVAQRGNLGVFGTSIAAAWLFAELEGLVGFFVDEDPNRFGRSYLGRAVCHPSQVPAGSEVFLALPGSAASRIRRRLQQEGVVYHLPPERS